MGGALERARPVTPVQFGAFSRIVIPDMTLAFFITLALLPITARARGGPGREGAITFLMHAAAAGDPGQRAARLRLSGMIVAASIAARERWSARPEMGSAGAH
jgi:4-amino-4-deoxy-L-arabinose transferase-like glycosyltransferase